MITKITEALDVLGDLVGKIDDEQKKNEGIDALNYLNGVIKENCLLRKKADDLYEGRSLFEAGL